MSDTSSRGLPRIALYAAIALIYFTLPNLYPHFLSPNELSRIGLTRALVEHQSFRLDWYLKNPTPQNVSDLALYDGHFYSDKAAGMSLLAVPFIAALRLIAPDASMTTMIFVARLCTVTIPALAALWFVLQRCRTRVALLAVTGLFLGAVVFPQALSFTGHVTSAIAICAAAVLVEKRPWLAGLLTGAAIVIDFTMAIAAAGLIVVIVVKTRSAAKTALFAICCAAIASVQLVVNATCFGGPLDFAYRHMFTPADQMNRGTGFFGIALPRPDAILGLTFGGSRGMFVHSPFLLLALPAAIVALRKPRDPLKVWAVAMCVAYFWLNASLVDWQGGWTLGPRYLTLIYPLLAWFLLEIPERFRPLLVLTVTWSVLLHLASMLTWSAPPFASFLSFPALQLSSFLALRGVFAPALLGVAVTAVAGIAAIVIAAGVRAWPCVLIAALVFAIAFAAAAPRQGSEAARRFAIFIRYMT